MFFQNELKNANLFERNVFQFKNSSKISQYIIFSGFLWALRIYPRPELK